MFLQILATFLFIIVLNYSLIKFGFLLDLNTKFSHKKFAKSKKIIPLSGGLIIIILSSYFNFQNYIFLLSTFLILILGLASDIDLLRSPKARIIAQTSILFLYISVSNNFFSDLRVNELNLILNIYIIAIFFNIFCYLVLINGSNLIDGLNSIVIGYFLSIATILIVLNNEYNFVLEINYLKTIILILTIIYLFNLFGKMYLGDSGAYLISFIFGAFLIKLYNQNPSISPYFIMCLLWYPAFENLFSIVRKSLNKISFQKADNKHLHQYLYKFFLKKFKLKKEIINSFTGNIIVLYNLIYFYLIKDFYFYTQGLIISVFFNILIYVLIYFWLSKKIKI